MDDWSPSPKPERSQRTGAQPPEPHEPTPTTAPTARLSPPRQAPTTGADQPCPSARRLTRPGLARQHHNEVRGEAPKPLYPPSDPTMTSHHRTRTSKTANRPLTSPAPSWMTQTSLARSTACRSGGPASSLTIAFVFSLTRSERAHRRDAGVVRDRPGSGRRRAIDSPSSSGDGRPRDARDRRNAGGSRARTDPHPRRPKRARGLTLAMRVPGTPRLSARSPVPRGSRVDALARAFRESAASSASA